MYRNNAWYTGCGADTLDEENTARNCKNAFGTKDDGVYKQTTNGNISGIFDMSGDNSEHVMAYGYLSNKGNYSSASGFTDETYPGYKYVDEYAKVYGSSQYGSRILGDATGELGPFKSLNDSWYDGSAYFVGDASWLGRGRGGLFSFYKGTGGGGSSAFHIVIV